MKDIHIESVNFQKEPFPFILRKYVDSSFSDFYTNWHMEIEVILLMEGSEVVYVDDAVYNVLPGEILVINSGKVHTGMQSSKWRHHCIIPSMEFLDGLGIDAAALTLQPLIRDESLKRLFEEIVLQSDEDGVYQHALTQVAAERFFLELFKRCSTAATAKKADKKNANFAIVIQVINYLRNHFAEDFPIENISREIGITTAYMCRCVKQSTGMTIVEHLNTIRCRAAYHYLAHSDKKVREVAAICGFNGNSYFSKTFQHVMGFSPSDVRKAKE